MVLGRISLVPRNAQFFELFERLASHLLEAAHALLDLIEHFEDVDGKVRLIEDLEHRGDETTHAIFAALNRTFVTPIDREDIALLAHSLDDVLDFMNAPAARLKLYRIAQPTPPAHELARVIVRQVEQIQAAVPLLRTMGKADAVLAHAVEINRLENEADDIIEGALATLFDEADDVAGLRLAIKWREIYELLETCTDRAEDVANTLEAIVLKHA